MVNSFAVHVDGLARVFWQMNLVCLGLAVLGWFAGVVVGGVGLDFMIGAGLSLFDTLVLWLIVRSARSLKQAALVRSALFFLAKMILLIGLVWMVIRFVPMNFLAFISGLSIMFISIVVVGGVRLPSLLDKGEML